MARVVERGLRRTVGVPGLFATAYGNVGSSIYYALGIVAAHALGLTPVVSEVIFLSTVHAPASEQHALGPTSSYLLAQRPCRIVVETAPNGNGQPRLGAPPVRENTGVASGA